MVQVWDKLDTAIRRDLNALHMKRDAYINELLTREIEELAKEVTLINSDEIRKLFRQRPLPNRKKVNLDLNEELVARMDEVLIARNIARDSFINRIFFFLVARDGHLEALGVDFEEEPSLKGKPLGIALEHLRDPLYRIRVANDGRFYTLSCFPDGPYFPGGPNLFSLNVAVTATQWEEFRRAAEIDLADFGILSTETENA